MEGAVKQGGLDIDHLIAGQDTGLHCALNTLIDCGDVFLRNSTAGDLVDELVALAGLVRLDSELDVCELAFTAGLTRVAGVNRCGLPDGLLVGNLRLADVGLYLELAQKSVDDNFKMKLAHACDDGLTGLFVRIGLEGRVFLCKLLKGDTHFLLTCLGFRLDSDANDRLGELHGFEDNRGFFIAESVTGGGVLETDRGGDIAGVDDFKVLSVVCVHLKDAADTLALTLGGVENGLAGLKGAGVNAEESELADIWVSHDLERECREGAVIIGRPRLGLFGLGIDALDCGNIQRGGHIVHDRVEQLLHALVFVRSTAYDRHHLDSDGSLSDCSANLVGGDILALKVHFHDIIIEI